ncbi:MAG TPA: PilZ domain-containing protein [Candidatus Dormibacteraeota bacterium]|nr:PilZ domain-containing protein [Candidatus Dormibacteraeota bacterium]
MVKQVLWSESVRDRIDSGRPHFLARACLKALSAGAGSVLLDVAATDRPDLIVLAPEASDMGAPDLCRRIRQDDRTRGIPILALASDDTQEFLFREAGCTDVVRASIPAALLQEKIAAMLGMRLRQHPRYPVVLPVARGRFIREFLGYSNAVSEGGIGFDTLARIKGGEHLALRIYRNTEEKPIAVSGRVASVRANIDTGIGYAVGVEFLEMAETDKERLVELFPRDASVVWGGDPGPERTPDGRKIPTV